MCIVAIDLKLWCHCHVCWFKYILCWCHCHACWIEYIIFFNAVYVPQVQILANNQETSNITVPSLICLPALLAALLNGVELEIFRKLQLCSDVIDSILSTLAASHNGGNKYPSWRCLQSFCWCHCQVDWAFCYLNSQFLTLYSLQVQVRVPHTYFCRKFALSFWHVFLLLPAQ